MKNKKLITTLASVGLVAVLAVGGTLAYFSAVTDTATNSFTMGSGIEGDVQEPAWDGGTPEDDTDGGEGDAKNFYPGQIIHKDPRIVNNSAFGVQAAYVAATISYRMEDEHGVMQDATFAQLDQFINFKTAQRDEDGNIVTVNEVVQYNDGFNTSESTWEMAQGNTIAYYKSKLAGKATATATEGTSTVNLFDAVEIDPLALTPEMVASGKNNTPMFTVSNYTDNGLDYTTYEMANFEIIVTGYLTQTAGFADEKTAMYTAFPSVFPAPSTEGN